MDYYIVYDGHRCIEKPKRKMQRVVVGTGPPPRLGLRHGKRGITRSHFGGTTRAHDRKNTLCVAFEPIGQLCARIFRRQKDFPRFFVVADSRTGIETNDTFFSEEQKSISVQIFRRKLNPCPPALFVDTWKSRLLFPEGRKKSAHRRSATEREQSPVRIRRPKRTKFCGGSG